MTGLQRDLGAGAATLTFDGRQGFLRSLLARLNVPVESQILLFSKTGIQNPFTTPENPRALYFNDRVVVGYIPGAPVIEMASHDPAGRDLSDAEAGWRRAGIRAARSLLSCHLSANSMTCPASWCAACRRLPTGGRCRNGSFLIDHRSPLEQRWGGWYVSRPRYSSLTSDPLIP